MGKMETADKCGLDLPPCASAQGDGRAPMFESTCANGFCHIPRGMPCGPLQTVSSDDIGLGENLGKHQCLEESCSVFYIPHFADEGTSGRVGDNYKIDCSNEANCARYGANFHCNYNTRTCESHQCGTPADLF